MLDLMPAPDVVLHSRCVEAELRDFREGIAPIPMHWPHHVQRLAKFIHENIFEPWLNVSEARRQCRLTNNNVSTQFKYAVGLGTRDYIEHLRMQAAIRLLHHPEGFQIHHIANAIGYSYVESFNAVFRRRFSSSPTAYRRSAEKKMKLPRRNGFAVVR